MVVVDRDQRLVVVVQDAFQLFGLGSLFQDLVDFLDRGVAGGDERQVDQRDVDGRHAHGKAVQLAVQLGQHQTDRSGSAGLGRDHGVGSRTGTTQIGVIDVGQHLVVGVGVDGGHQAVEQADFFMQRLDQRSQAVGGARGVGDDGVRSLQHALVDAIDDGGVHILAAGGGDDDLLGTTGQVGAGLFLGGEQAGALQHHVHVQILPGQFAGITLGQHLDLVAIDDQVIALDLDVTVELAMGGVVLGQVCIGFGLAEIIDGDDLDVVLLAAFIVGTQHIAANPAITIDCNANRHFYFPL